jgi:hypothetical protein
MQAEKSAHFFETKNHLPCQTAITIDHVVTFAQSFPALWILRLIEIHVLIAFVLNGMTTGHSMV